jgi:hypothetical protein
VIARWISFWDRREGPESLALARILVALVILIDLTSALLLGLVPDLWAPPPTGLGWVGLEATPPPLTRLFGASSATVLVVFVLAYASALLLLAGVVMLPAGALFAIASAELARLAPDGERGVDKLLRIAVMVLALSGADARVEAALGLSGDMAGIFIDPDHTAGLFQAQKMALVPGPVPACTNPMQAAGLLTRTRSLSCPPWRGSCLRGRRCRVDP